MILLIQARMENQVPFCALKRAVNGPPSPGRESHLPQWITQAWRNEKLQLSEPAHWKGVNTARIICTVLLGHLLCF